MAEKVLGFDPEDEALAAGGLPGTEFGDPLEDPWSEDADG
jgi:hypothetical protein